MKLLWLPKSPGFRGLTGWKPVLMKQQKLDVNAYQTGPSTPDPAQQVKVIEDLIAKTSTPSSWYRMTPRSLSQY